MKPFRGKPEKPEISKGVIQRVSRGGEFERFADRDDLRVRPRLAFYPTPVERVHFSSSRTSRPVGRRSKGVVVDRASLSSVRSRTPRVHPACVRPTVRQRRWAANFVRVRPVASAVDSIRTCRTRCRLRNRPAVGDGVLGRTHSRHVSVDAPVCDAYDLGTFRTRLETRTKESSMCASHWDQRILKAY